MRCGPKKVLTYSDRPQGVSGRAPSSTKWRFLVGKPVAKSAGGGGPWPPEIPWILALEHLQRRMDPTIAPHFLDHVYCLPDGGTSPSPHVLAGTERPNVCSGFCDATRMGDKLFPGGARPLHPGQMRIMSRTDHIRGPACGLGKLPHKYAHPRFRSLKSCCMWEI